MSSGDLTEVFPSPQSGAVFDGQGGFFSKSSVEFHNIY